MKNNEISMLITLPSYGRRFPNTLPYWKNGFQVKFPLDGLEAKINDSFATRGMAILPEYFNPDSDYFPKNLSFFVFGINLDDYEIVSGLIATSEQVGDFKFTYYDKIFVNPELMNNGLMGKMKVMLLHN